MAQLKKLPPIPPKVSKNSQVSSLTNSNNKNWTGSGIGLINYNISNAGTLTKDSSPRRYYNQNRQSRVLSPEPENRYTPTVSFF